MRILIALSYYKPHVSGLTNYAQRLAEGLAGLGHAVTVLTTRHRPELPPEEVRRGVRVVRAPVWATFGKAVLVHGYRKEARRLTGTHDLLVVHLPISPLEASALLRASRRTQCPIVVVYHCDLTLDRSLLNTLAQRWVAGATRRVLSAAHRIAVLSLDYAATSPALEPHLSKCRVVPPPVPASLTPAGTATGWRERHAPGAAAVIGLAARIASEKGIEHLLQGRELLHQLLGDTRILITGENHAALGEEAYHQRIQPLLEAWGDRVTFLGPLAEEEMPAFFAACDVTVLPSVNRTESFGLVQVESMLCGTPVVATDLPGVREAVLRSGSGLLAPPGDAEALARTIACAVTSRQDLSRTPAQIRAVFGLDTWLDEWQQLLAEWDAGQHDPGECPDELERLMALHTREIPPFRALVRAVETHLIRQFGPRHSAALDLGCGDGLFGGMTLPTPIACGLDPDRASLDHAERVGAHRRLLHGPAGHIPLDGETFDLVLANSVLEHIPQLAPVLSEVHRVLAQGGWFVITVPSDRFAEGFGVAVTLERLRLPSLARRYRDWFNGISRHFHTDGIQAWRERLKAAGFSVVHQEDYLSRSAMFWFDLLHYASLPCLFSHRLTGRWHVLGAPLFASAWTRFLTRLAKRPLEHDGAYVFILARKD